MIAALPAAFASEPSPAADCARRVTESELAGEVAAVEASFADGDEQRFRDGYTLLARAVSCLGEVPRPETMARVRLVDGVRAFGAGEVDLAAGSFLAARALSPEVAVPVYPADHEIWGVFRRWDPVRAERIRLPTPRSGSVFVDGYDTRDRFERAPALVQLVDGDQLTSWTLGPGDLPAYPVRHPVRTSLLAASASLAAVGGGLLAASAGPRGEFRSGDVRSVAELASLRSATNTLSAGGLAAFGLAAGAGVAAAVEWRR